MGKYQVIAILTCLLAVHQVTGQGHESNEENQKREVRCPAVQPGPQGWPGEEGKVGEKGEKGDPGENAYSRFQPPIGTPCRCPDGPKGKKGEQGLPGAAGKKGDEGVLGIPGFPGEKGQAGVPGTPGPLISPVSPSQPPETPGTLYVPVMISGKMPKVVCHHLRRHAYVPVVPNKFIGWHEPGKSGYLTYGKWLYYSSRFMCPCSVHLPPGPTPSPEEMMRRLLKRK